MVGTVNFTGQAQGKASFAMSQSQLREGVELRAVDGAWEEAGHQPR